MGETSQNAFEELDWAKCKEHVYRDWTPGSAPPPVRPTAHVYGAHWAHKLTRATGSSSRLVTHVKYILNWQTGVPRFFLAYRTFGDARSPHELDWRLDVRIVQTDADEEVASFSSPARRLQPALTHARDYLNPDWPKGETRDEAVEWGRPVNQQLDWWLATFVREKRKKPALSLPDLVLEFEPVLPAAIAPGQHVEFSVAYRLPAAPDVLEGLRALLADGDGCDVQLRAADGAIARAHGVVLAAASPPSKDLVS